MRCSVKQAQSQIDSPEFSEWMAFDQIEPLGSYADDYRAALICRTLAGGKLDDFLLDWGNQRGNATPDGRALLQAARIITEVLTSMKQQQNG